MPMYNLLEYSDNYCKMPGSLWNYYRDKINDSANKNNDANNYRINKNKTTTSKSFEYKTKIKGRMPNDNNILHAEVVVPLKYLSSFCRSLNLPLINCEIEFDLLWSRYWIISEISGTPAVPANPPAPTIEATQTTGATFQINNAKLYVAVVTFSINDNIKFLQNITQGLKRTISWKKYRSELTTQPTSPWELMDSRTKNDSRHSKTQDIQKS